MTGRRFAFLGIVLKIDAEVRKDGLSFAFLPDCSSFLRPESVASN